MFNSIGNLAHDMHKIIFQPKQMSGLKNTLLLIQINLSFILSKINRQNNMSNY